MKYPRGSSAARGYGSKWRKARAVFIVENPLCAYCARSNRIKTAEVVDHIVPHKGDTALFWDVDNWQALCKRCHDSAKQREERESTIGCDATGIPVTPATARYRHTGEG